MNKFAIVCICLLVFVAVFQVEVVESGGYGGGGRGGGGGGGYGGGGHGGGGGGGGKRG